MAAVTSGSRLGPSAAAALVCRGSLGLAGLAAALSARLSWRPGGARQVVPDPPDDVVVLRQTAALPPVGVDDGLVDIHVEEPDRPFPDIRFPSEFLLDDGRQTGGRTEEPSLVAVDYLHLSGVTRLSCFGHGTLLS
jgi:hypothetical protein